MPRTSALLLPFVVLVPSCVSYDAYSAAVWVADEETFTVDPAGLTELRCTTTNGKVAITGADDQRITVQVAKKGGGVDDADAARALAAIEILQERSGGGIALGWRWREPRASRWHASVSFTVTQPRALPVTVETHNGSIRLSSLHGAVVARTHNGRLDLADCKGAIDGVTHNGSIEADVTTSDLSLRTHNGAVHVVLRGDGPVAGTICSHNGDVRLGVAGQPSTRLVCATDNGRVACNRTLDRAEHGRTFLVGDLGAARGRLAVETRNGSIRID